MTEKRLDGYITFKLSDVNFSSPSLKGELLFYSFLFMQLHTVLRHTNDKYLLINT